jgi:catechol 2,3-dioxygenase-like lactoylglutathione lyase family enzyme
VASEPDHPERWPAQLPVRQVRVARPTDQLEAVERFYREGLGLVELERFEDHRGYSGVMFGLPGTDHHLEFTTHVDGSPGVAPSRDNLLVLYLGAAAEVEAVADRLAAVGHHPIEAENPYWGKVGGVTVEDPDGWRVVLVPAPIF